MQHILGYMIAAMASAVGWKLGCLISPFLGFFASLVFAALGLWTSRRWLRELLG